MLLFLPRLLGLRDRLLPMICWGSLGLCTACGGSLLAQSPTPSPSPTVVGNQVVALGRLQPQGEVIK
ncbi:MAG: hypothetical protein MUF49_04835, partial [Oculatellaceae cyanobacterium Prado106]|nr:hypothetical protein [Oculatellaceae cyanobacterium Prado106]